MILDSLDPVITSKKMRTTIVINIKPNGLNNNYNNNNIKDESKNKILLVGWLQLQSWEKYDKKFFTDISRLCAVKFTATKKANLHLT